MSLAPQYATVMIATRVIGTPACSTKIFHFRSVHAFTLRIICDVPQRDLVSPRVKNFLED